jgi:hypothetical protein
MTKTNKKRCTYPEGRDKCYQAEEEIYCKSNDKKPCIYKYFKDAKEEEEACQDIKQ